MTLLKLPKNRYKLPNESDVPAIYHKINELIKAYNEIASDVEEGVEIYEAVIRQSGTNPIVVVSKDAAGNTNPLINTLIGAPVYTRQDVGSYTGTLVGGFPVGRSTIEIIGQSSNVSALNDSTEAIGYGFNDADSFYISSGKRTAAGACDVSDDAIYDYLIRIKVRR